MRPVVLVDCDGVLSDFAGAILEYVFHETGVRLTPNDITTWHLFEGPAFAPVRRAERRVFARVASLGECYALSVLPGAQAGLAALREIADVRIVTAPMSSSETWCSERSEWLRKHFGIHEHDVIYAHRKDLVRGDFFIDDKPENISAWQAAHPAGEAFLWAAPHNRGPEKVRYSCWRHVRGRVAARGACP